MTRSILPDIMYLRECFEYQPETGILAWRYRPLAHFIHNPEPERRWKIWNSNEAFREAGSAQKYTGGKIYRSIRLNDTPLLGHRLIWKLVTSQEPPFIIDHRDGDGLNNRWSNLRAATERQNRFNSLGRERKIDSLPKGVFWLHDGPRYRASITLNRKNIHLGCFSTAEEAHKAYRDAATLHHKEFTNFGRVKAGHD